MGTGLLFPATTPAQKVMPDQPPSWAASVIWYQIFAERFYNGDPSNDPTPENINIPPLGVAAPDGWKITPWTANWWAKEDWAMAAGMNMNELLQFRRYGGDLQGVLDKLDYLSELGINALYMNPLNDAPSLHKYDARSYHHIDVNFGPDPDGDLEIIRSETFDDPATWKWTSADKLFLKLIGECHNRGIRIIMDYSWNHTGVLFPAWLDILKNQEKSAYRDWYAIERWDDPATEVNEFAYKGWAGVPSLPELRKSEITTVRKSGYPYEGNMNPGAKQHIFDVTQRWLAPDGDTARGIDGFRLDVADQIGLGFWRDYRKFVRSVKPDAYLVGEIWWARWPDELMDPLPYLHGDVFDAVMFYQVYKPARYFFAKTGYGITAEAFRDSLAGWFNRLPFNSLQAMMNTASSHDTPRLLTDFYNPNKYKYHSNPNEDTLYNTGKPDEETYRHLRLYLVHLFTTAGAPHIWNGEEMGMWGADDPFCRKPLMWDEYRFEDETRTNVQKRPASYDALVFNRDHYEWYQKLIAIRKSNPVLMTGKFEFLTAQDKTLVYKRFDEKTEIRVCFNLSDKPVTIAFPVKKKALDLLTGAKIQGSELSLPPMSSLILKLMDN